jgi:hypothetical protein
MQRFFGSAFSHYPNSFRKKIIMDAPRFTGKLAVCHFPVNEELIYIKLTIFGRRGYVEYEFRKAKE